jgi:hypothetical protein
MAFCFCLPTAKLVIKAQKFLDLQPGQGWEGLMDKASLSFGHMSELLLNEMASGPERSDFHYFALGEGVCMV